MAAGSPGLVPLPLPLQLPHSSLKLVLLGDGPAQQFLVGDVLRPLHPHVHPAPPPGEPRPHPAGPSGPGWTGRSPVPPPPPPWTPSGLTLPSLFTRYRRTRRGVASGPNPVHFTPGILVPLFILPPDRSGDASSPFSYLKPASFGLHGPRDWGLPGQFWTPSGRCGETGLRQ